MKPKRNFVEVRRIFRKEPGDRAMCYPGDWVFLDAIPDAERQEPSFTQHPAGFAKRRCLVGNKHQTELTYHRSERCCGKRKVHRIRLLPPDPVVPKLPPP